MDYSRISKILFLVFNFIMVFVFAICFLFPVWTNYWIINSGFAILIFEFLSVFVMCFTFIKGVSENITVKIILTSAFLGFVTLPLFFAFIFSYFVFHNIYLFFYFAASAFVKIFLIKTHEELEGIGKQMGKIMFSVIVGAFIALFLSGFIGSFFTSQQDVLRDEMIRQAEIDGGSVSGEIVNNPIYLMFWGVSYFVLISIFELKPDNLKKKI